MTEYSQVALMDTDMVFDVDAESRSLEESGAVQLTMNE